MAAHSSKLLQLFGPSPAHVKVAVQRSMYRAPRHNASCFSRAERPLRDAI